MGLLDRDYTQWKGSKRYKDWVSSGHPILLHCPICGKASLFWNWHDEVYECLNVECRARGNSIDRLYRPCRVASYVGSSGKELHASKYHRRNRTLHEVKSNEWLLALLLIFSLLMLGLGISVLVGNSIPIWLLFGFSVSYSTEKWFRYYTRKYKWIGKIYRLSLNLGILCLLGLIIWSGTKLFSQQYFSTPLVGSLLFLAEFTFLIWMWRTISKNSWRWPSMKLTVFSVICVFIVLAFAGVSPFSVYKDSFINVFTGSNDYVTQPPIDDSTTSAPDESDQTTITPVTVGIDSRTGEYENYYLGLVKEPDGVISGNGCYGEFIVLINNKNAKNPTYSELLDFLRADTTDKFPYQYTLPVMEFYYGEAEDKIDLSILKRIIDCTAEPSPPKICGDFAERLHNEAEMAGIRCAYVTLEMIGYTDPYSLEIESDAGHACNAFETIDRGLVYIDCTGFLDSCGPVNNDMIVDLEVGEQYNPQYLFPSGGWYIPTGMMGTVTSIFTTWDGDWR